MADIAAAGHFSHLQYDGRAGLELQHARHAERLELRVGVVDEVGVVESHQRLDVVQLEAELVGSLRDLLMPGQADGEFGRLAQHGRLTDDLTQLDGGERQTREEEEEGLGGERHRFESTVVDKRKLNETV